MRVGVNNGLGRDIAFLTHVRTIQRTRKRDKKNRISVFLNLSQDEWQICALSIKYAYVYIIDYCEIFLLCTVCRE